MARPLRFTPPDLPLHIVQSGNYGQSLFTSDLDRGRFLELLREHAGERRVRVAAYCLMDAHIHLVLVPRTEEGVPRLMQVLTSDYARWLHHRQNRSGHLWQSRYESAVLDEPGLVIALAYVELSPVRAALVAEAGEYPWSSAPAHCAKVAAPAWLDLVEFSRRYTHAEWMERLSAGLSREAQSGLELATRLGRPFGSTGFVRELERTFDRRLLPRRAGRPVQIRRAG